MANINLITYGCSINKSDSERIRGISERDEHRFTSLEDAEVVIINSCSVKNPTITKFKKTLEQVKGKKVIIAGCIPKTEYDLVKGYSLVVPDQIENISYVIEETLKGNVVELLTEYDGNCLDLPSIRKNPVVEIIPISKGCLGSCSYCVVNKARGSLYSYPIDSIVKTAKKAIKSGAKELWLTSQDCGCYGKDIGTTLVELLGKVVVINGEFKIRLGMANPEHLVSIIDDLLNILKTEKMFKFVHIPLQSGSDSVLRSMNRKYTVEEFKCLVNKLRKKIPTITIATDIIVGYPTETEEDFKNTLSLVGYLKPDVINISRYWARPETFAASLKQLSGKLIKERSRQLTEVFRDYCIKQKRQWIGKELNVLFDELGGSVGRTDNYLSVKLVTSKGLYGHTVRVFIESATTFGLKGSIVSKL